MDLFGDFLRITPNFKGKWRLFNYWSNSLKEQGKRIAKLPDNLNLEVDMRIRYERMIWLGDEEKEELLFIKSKLQNGETFVDIGANIGLWTCVAANLVGENGSVVSFEPNPTTYLKLKANIERNSLKNVVPIQAAVSENVGFVDFLCQENHNLSLISNTENGKSIKINSVSLDSELSKVLDNSKIDGLKIDVEGHEFEVLKGSTNTIQTHFPWFIIEFNTEFIDSNELKNWNVYQLLKGFGYKAYSYIKNKQIEIGDNFTYEGHCNILFEK